MNDPKIIELLEKLNSNFEFQKKVTKYLLYFLIPFLIISFSFYFYVKFLYSPSTQKKEPDYWNARDNARNGNIDKAIKEAKSIIAKNPKDPFLYIQLSEYYVRKGEIDKALEYAISANNLYPSENNHKNIKVLKNLLNNSTKSN